MITDFLNKNKINWFYTGSREFGVNKNESDYDVCVEVSENYQALGKYLTDNKIEKTESNYNNGFYITEDEKKINIIPLPLDIFRTWKMCTNTIKAACNQDPDIKSRLRSKDKRIALFEILKGFYRIA